MMSMESDAIGKIQEAMESLGASEMSRVVAYILRWMADKFDERADRILKIATDLESKELAKDQA